jgi:hypothetical protein
MLMAGQEEVVKHRKSPEQFKVLEGPGDPYVGNLVGRGMGKIAVAISYGALAGVVKTGNTVENTCFPGAVRSDYRGNDPGLYGDIDVRKSVQPAKRQRHIRNNEMRHKELDRFSHLLILNIRLPPYPPNIL